MAFTIKKFIDRTKLRADLEVDEHSIDDAMFKQSGLTAFYGELLADAQEQLSRAKLRLETTEAMLYKTYRKVALADKENKATEKSLAADVAADRRMITAKKDVILAQEEVDRVKIAVEALKQRRDMLVQLNKNQLEDMKGELRLQILKELDSKFGTKAEQAKGRVMDILKGE